VSHTARIEICAFVREFLRGARGLNTRALLKKGQSVNRKADQGAGAAIPLRLNLALVVAFLAIGGFQLFALPTLLHRFGPWWALLLIPCALSTTANWSLIHEAIHRLLAPTQRLNDLCGRALAIFFGSPFESLRFPHLVHHHMNGTVADRPEHYESARHTRRAVAVRYYPNLLIGIYAAELAGTFLCLMPRPLVRRVVNLLPKAHDEDARAESYLLEPNRLARLRVDACAIIALYALAFWCYGPYWPLLVLAILARGVLVSVADNSYHYGAPLGAGPRSAYNLRLPAGAAILHFNLHRVHHLHPTLPWSSLPGAFEADGERHDIGYVSAMLRQFRGPIPDSEYSRVS
jgi:fatty acid desaturase